MEKDGRDGIYEQAEELGNEEKGKVEQGYSVYKKTEELGQENAEDKHKFMADLEDSKENTHGEEHPHKRAAAYKDIFVKDAFLTDEEEGIYENAEGLAKKEKEVPGGGGSSYHTAEELSHENESEKHKFMADSDDEL